MVDFPEPVCPTMAVVVPAGTVKDTFRRTTRGSGGWPGVAGPGDANGPTPSPAMHACIHTTAPQQHHGRDYKSGVQVGGRGASCPLAKCVCVLAPPGLQLTHQPQQPGTTSMCDWHPRTHPRTTTHTQTKNKNQNQNQDQDQDGGKGRPVPGVAPVPRPRLGPRGVAATGDPMEPRGLAGPPGGRASASSCRASATVVFCAHGTRAGNMYREHVQRTRAECKDK
jgi:hypothetical protein